MDKEKKNKTMAQISVDFANFMRGFDEGRGYTLVEYRRIYIARTDLRVNYILKTAKKEIEERNKRLMKERNIYCGDF